MVLNNFIQTLYNLTGTYWLGQIGKESVAAITVVAPVQNVILQFGQGISLAGSVLISQFFGAKDDENARDMAGRVFACAMIFSLGAAFLCFISTSAIVGWLGAEGTVGSSAKTYLRIIVLDMPFLFMINLYSAVNQAQGDTVKPMFLNLLGIVLNMIMDPFLMFGLNLGITGAALATLSAKIPGAVIAFISLADKKKLIYIDIFNIHIKADMLKTIIKVGLPMALGGSTMQFGFLLIAKNVLKYGDAATAAYGIGNRVNSIITLPSTAVGSAVATIVGQNIGAGKRERAEKAYKLACFISVAFLFVCGMTLSRSFVNSPIVNIFANGDEEVLAMGSEFVSIMAFWCFTNGVYNSTSGLFQGSGHTLVYMVVDASRLWIFRLSTIWVCENILHMQEQSIWYAVVVSNGIGAAMLFIAYKLGIWKKDIIKQKKLKLKNYKVLILTAFYFYGIFIYNLNISLNFNSL
ncbi:MAG: MATE family efflux transporter [Clostridiales bacterium]|nr:MATE family efflux transporter [Clostridiales bacterium]